MSLRGLKNYYQLNPRSYCKRLSDMKYYFDLALYEAQFVETIPLDERVQNNPILGIGSTQSGEVTYAGADFSRKLRLLELKVPVSEACQNDALVKSFYTWERWQGVLPTLSNILRKETRRHARGVGVIEFQEAELNVPSPVIAVLDAVTYSTT